MDDKLRGHIGDILKGRPPPPPPAADELPPYDPGVEQFQVHDSETKLNTPIRTLTDQQLLKAWRASKQQHAQTNVALAQAAANFASAQASFVMFGYEIDRRRRLGIVLATAVDIPK